MADTNSSNTEGDQVASKPSGGFSLSSFIQERGAFSRYIEIPRDRSPWFFTLVLILAAYLLSFWVRLEWIDFAQANFVNEQGEVVFAHPEMVKDGVALPNTHDSFYFGSIVQKASFGKHQDNHLIPDVYLNGMITALPYWILQVFPSLTIEELLLWLPVYIAGLVCIPIVLIGRLYGSSVWGFFAACLAGITHSYYNRTLAGYYDTDMFSITSPAFSLFFLLAASRKESIGYLCAATVSLLVGCFFYGSVQAITCSLAIVFIAYRVALLGLDFWNQKKLSNFWELKSLPFTIASVLCMSWVLYADSWFAGRVVGENFGKSLAALLLPIVIFFTFTIYRQKLFPADNVGKLRLKMAGYTSGVLLILVAIGTAPFLGIGPYSGTWYKLTGKLKGYSVISQSNAVTSGSQRYSLSFLDVRTTIREASEVPKEVVRNRILSDIPSCSCPRCLSAKDRESTTLISASILGFIGLFFLVIRYWEFCLIFPFIAIAYYCFQGSVGLRFTVHVGNVASIGVTFLLLFVLWSIIRKIFLGRGFTEKKQILASWLTVGGALPCVVFLAIPNVKHAQNYHSHVVYPTETIEVLEALDKASNPEDFVVTWWDYGSGCWYYGDLRSFTSPAHQTYDNYLTSKILRSNSPLRASRLARLKTEAFVKMQENKENGESDYNTAVQAIFKDGQSDSVFYQGLLNDLGNPNVELPKKTREMFLFLPYEILRIFPTILSFSSRNLYFSKDLSNEKVKSPPITILRNGRREGSSIAFDGGFRLDRRGQLRIDQPQSGMIPYNLFLGSNGDGNPPKPIKTLEFDGLSIPLITSPSSSYQLLYVKETGEIVILSAAASRSTFARRFLLDRFDLEVFKHPLFEKGANPVRQPFMVQADWVSGNPGKLNLHMRGNYKIEVDLKQNLAKIPGSSNQIPFSFHRRLHDTKTGKMIKMPSKVAENAGYHLIQSNIPVFVGGSSYEVPDTGKTISQIATLFGIDPKLLSSVYQKDEDYFYYAGERLEIPAKGYEMRQAWFFMDNEAFQSILVQGFLMEELPNNLFEKVYSTAWGKVYKIKQ
ncbi:MAG: STT3 domain-containing protein [Opitutales bacterium]|nr:STT3 domain-containing protein [Opitutales bacterium]